MAGGQERILRRRIRTIEATKKITRSFELIAASQIARAQGRIAKAQPYQRALSDLLAETARETPGASRLVGTPSSPQNVLTLVIVADRGLAGAYNSSVLRAAERLIRASAGAGRNERIIAVGKKAQAYFRFRHQTVEQQFVGVTDRPRFEDARRIAAGIVPLFLDGEVDLVRVVSTRVRSASIQAVETRQLLPVREAEKPAAAGHREDGAAEPPAGVQPPASRAGFFEFEPDTEQLLARLVPRYAEASIYGALLEASASEHAARQRAMAAATENADELLKTLRRVMNRARQDTITTEIMEIVGGSEALRAGAGHDTSYPTEEQSE